MKYAIRITLFIGILVLTYLTYESVMKDVRYAKHVKEKESGIIDKLKIARKGQLTYKEVNGVFADNWDTLLSFMNHGKIKVIVAFGDADDSTTVFTQSVVNVSVKDSFFKEVEVDKLRFVPERDTLQFLIDAGTVMKNGVPVPVYQITDPDPYDKQRIEEKNPLRVGSMFSVDYNGNWKN